MRTGRSVILGALAVCGLALGAARSDAAVIWQISGNVTEIEGGAAVVATLGSLGIAPGTPWTGELTFDNAPPTVSGFAFWQFDHSNAHWTFQMGDLAAETQVLNQAGVFVQVNPPYTTVSIAATVAGNQAALQFLGGQLFLASTDWTVFPLEALPCCAPDLSKVDISLFRILGAASGAGMTINASVNLDRARARARVTPRAPRARVRASHSPAGRSQAGAHQFHFPSSCIVAGTSRARTSVTSSAIAAAMPTPICFT